MASSSSGDRSLRSSAVVLTLTGALLGLATSVAGSLLSFKPNRIVDGLSASAPEALGYLAWLAAALWAVTAGLALVSSRPLAAGVGALVATAAITLTLAGSGQAALDFAAAGGSVARTSFGPAMYLGLLGYVLVLYACARRMAHRVARAAVWLLPVAALGGLAAAGLVAEFGGMGFTTNDTIFTAALLNFEWVTGREG